jgi:hypothetical protein
LGRHSCAQLRFGEYWYLWIMVKIYYDLLLSIYLLCMIRPPCLIGTWRTSRENNVTTITFMALVLANWLRKLVCKNLPRQGQAGRSCSSIGRFSGWSSLWKLFRRGVHIPPLFETVAGFLVLVEICKVLVVNPASPPKKRFMGVLSP